MVTLRVDVDGEIHDYVKNEAVKFDFQILYFQVPISLHTYRKSRLKTLLSCSPESDKNLLANRTFANSSSHGRLSTDRRKYV